MRYASAAKATAAALCLSIHLGLLFGCDSGGEDAGPFTEEEILAVPAPTYEGFMLAFETVEEANPDVDTDSDEFARLLLNEIRGQGDDLHRGTAHALGSMDPFDLLRRLNEAEWLLVMLNPVKGYRTHEATEQASEAAETQFPQVSLFKGNGDAFRHAYWNFLMAYCCGVEWAEDFANAHESETPAGDDKTMDLNNNEVGRRLYQGSPDLTEAAAQLALRQHAASCMETEVTLNTARLVYIQPCPTLMVGDNGPDFDDVFQVSLDGELLGITPAGGYQTFITSDVRTGVHPLTVRCEVDGTAGGCGYDVRLAHGLLLGDGTTTTPQLVMEQGEELTIDVHAPTLDGAMPPGFSPKPRAPEGTAVRRGSL